VRIDGVIDRFCLGLEIVIRPCEERDLAPLEWLGSFKTHRAFMHTQFERHVAGKNVMLVADRDGYPVGQVWLDLERERERRAAFVWALRVIAPFQGLGLGGRLLAAAEAIAAAAEVDVVELGVIKGHRRTRSFYERCGYRRVRDEVSEELYVAPDGSRSHDVYDQCILQKRLGMRRHAR
jgi:GNAT superfamily N-acetyltransferase